MIIQTSEHNLHIDWHLNYFEALSAQELYAVLAAREAVFVVEQNCAYQELDGLDTQALHLIGWAKHPLQVAAYLRILPPNSRFLEPSIGRVLTTQDFRRSGLGRILMQTGLAHLEHFYNGYDVRISAQSYLETFYSAFGFEPVSDLYMEDGIPHIEMIKRINIQKNVSETV